MLCLCVVYVNVRTNVSVAGLRCGSLTAHRTHSTLDWCSEDRARRGAGGSGSDRVSKPSRARKRLTDDANFSSLCSGPARVLARLIRRAPTALRTAKISHLICRSVACVATREQPRGFPPPDSSGPSPQLDPDHFKGVFGRSSMTSA